MRLALHTWTIDRSSIAQALETARATGWSGIELRLIDFQRSEAEGCSTDFVLDLIRGSGLQVACVGVEPGWMWAAGAERLRLLRVFEAQCRRAAALECRSVMSPVDRGSGDLGHAVAAVREVSDIAAAHGARLALEFNSQAEQVNTLERARELVMQANHRSCGLLLDTYHLGRSGATPRAIEDLQSGEIAYVQYSDPPRTGLRAGFILDRLPPGQGSFWFRDFFALLAAKRYDGFASYEAPNEQAWERDPVVVCREAIDASRATLDL
jgi:sugar phosphate isomerase/epimerase